ncbi:hypothetical protein N7448_010613 [Penicillium atrosanguineum]|uniref:Xylanolytic transcriptional activator regulatory domain-containing protein n=1 Tax=Penicillium atrosanguineum TaxID=1132637 RepID=A0A9W9U0C5_9EURO|nr:hypothetical protein N7526_010543 [Penicillium atrosanguineum]KAJ5119944.1 hypothetical protein N7448_010613 [Penicillium atrosanguineum]KAJ5299704.1 hypothetical protein N7476_011261 [Penicillium atrosanguineum]
MLFAVSLLLDPKNPSTVSYASQNFYDQAVVHYLPLVLRHPNRLRHVQAYLMMSMHSLFSPSTEQISLMTSAAMRYCVVSKFHLVESEPEPQTAAAQVDIQMRRRAFWAAYSFDRLACGVLGIPYSIPDDSVTVPLFEDLDDELLVEDPIQYREPLVFTTVSWALHRERLFLIQSEILNVTSRSDFSPDSESFTIWRASVLSKLENWRLKLSKASTSEGRHPVDERLILITYNLSLLLLHKPTKANVCGQTGDWALRASLQIIMIFRKFQSGKKIPHPWLGLINQFSVGITMLYCLWATPPQSRSEAYNSKNIFQAVRCCSNNLAVFAERWEQARDLVDVFELLATEVPLVEDIPANDNHNPRPVKRIRVEIADEILGKLPNVQSVVLNGDTYRMIKEMISDDLPTHVDDQKTPATEAGRGLENSINNRSMLTGHVLPNEPNSSPEYPLFGSYVPEVQSVPHWENISLQSFKFPGNVQGYEPL